MMPKDWKNSFIFIPKKKKENQTEMQSKVYRFLSSLFCKLVDRPGTFDKKLW